MQDTLTITITPELKAALLEITQAEGISADSLVGKAIEDYIFTHKFRALRSDLMQKNETVYTDEEIFEIIS
jgi:HEPN domain-containing protein